ncbi:cupredoxin domain-containing protein [Halorarius litoreus]|uniref:cupredoxin domain-containing protein n=1 Tax=Halorarius litoreus TaxID=2962676 RepID=UPI0020CBB1D4|nr:plastocyanin/azurin family copper-binding protein [Halorarius litoreus]
MTNTTAIDELELTDDELLEVLKNHGLSRRVLMKVFGVGAVASAFAGSAAAHSDRDRRIDMVYGAPYEASETVPSGLVDHEVLLHIHEDEEEGGTHADFPLEEGEDGELVEVPAEFFFDPVGLHVRAGDVVNFHTHNGLHTATSIHSKFNEEPFLEFPDRVPTANGFTSPPMVDGDSWLYRFSTAGIYDVMCLPHYGLGMVVRLVVTDGNGPVPEDPYDSALVPPNVATVFGAPEMTPENIVDEGSVAWEDLTL